MPVAAAAGAEEEEEEEEEVTMNPGAAAAAAEVANMMRCDREHAHELISMKSLKLRIGRRLKILLIYSSSLYFCFVLLLCTSALFFCFVLLLCSSALFFCFFLTRNGKVCRRVSQNRKTGRLDHRVTF
jgi:branched-subunit amino acid ABC-type transport system permease component